MIDVKAFKAESAAEVAARIRALLQYVPPDQLWLNPDCGFWVSPWTATCVGNQTPGVDLFEHGYELYCLRDT